MIKLITRHAVRRIISEKLDFPIFFIFYFFIFIFESVHKVTLKFWLDIPCCRRPTLYFFYQGTVSARKFRKRITKFKITIAMPKKFGCKGFITVVKVT